MIKALHVHIGWKELVKRTVREVAGLLDTITNTLSLVAPLGLTSPSPCSSCWPRAIVWLLASLAFKWYVARFGSYNATYGAIGGVIVLMLWFDVSGLAVLVGAKLNAEIEHASSEGKAPERVPGERGSKEGSPKRSGLGYRMSPSPWALYLNSCSNTPRSYLTRATSRLPRPAR